MEQPFEPQPTEAAAGDVLDDRDRVLLTFAYLGPLAAVTLFAGDSPFVRWHARQGLWFALTGLAVYLVLTPVHLACFWIHPAVGRLFAVVEICVALGLFAVASVCIARAQARSAFRLPLLAELADRT